MMNGYSVYEISLNYFPQASVLLLKSKLQKYWTYILWQWLIVYKCPREVFSVHCYTNLALFHWGSYKMQNHIQLCLSLSAVPFLLSEVSPFFPLPSWGESCLPCKGSKQNSRHKHYWWFSLISRARLFVRNQVLFLTDKQLYLWVIYCELKLIWRQNGLKLEWQPL